MMRDTLKKYKIKKKDMYKFGNAYQNIFNVNTYPNYIFNPKYEIYYLKIPHIPAKDLPQLKDIELSKISNIKLPSISKIDWDIYVRLMREIFNEENTFIKAYDYLAEELEEVYCLTKENLKSLGDNDIKNLINKISSKTLDEGFFMFGESSKWGLYYGEIFYDGISDTFLYIDFIIFALEREYSKKFMSVLKKFINSFNVMERARLSDIFKMDKSVMGVMGQTGAYEIKG